MKHTTCTFLVFLSLIGLWGFTQVTAQTWQYGRSLDFSWDSITQVWDSVARTTFNYSQPNQAWTESIRETKWGFPPTWQPLGRWGRTYDAADRLVNELTYTWNNATNSWRATEERFWIYNGVGDLAERGTLTIAVMGAIDTASHILFDYTYDANGRTTSQTIRQLNAFTGNYNFTSQEIYAYDTAAGWTSRISTYWNGTGWDTLGRENEVRWDDFASGKKRSSDFEQYGGFGQFTVLNRVIYNHLPNDSYEEYIWDYDCPWDTLIHVDRVRNDHLRDGQGNLVETSSHVLDSSGNWILYSGDQYVHTYDAQGLLRETVGWSFSWQGQGYEQKWKTEFLDALVLDLEEESLGANMSLFPNPMGGEGGVALEDLPAGEVELSIWGMDGRLLKEVLIQHPGGSAVHEIEANLPAGSYTYRLQQGDQSKTGKLVIHH